MDQKGTTNDAHFPHFHVDSGTYGLRAGLGGLSRDFRHARARHYHAGCKRCCSGRLRHLAPSQIGSHLSAITVTNPQLAAKSKGWAPIVWCALLLGLCYAPILKGLVLQWDQEPDMGHGFFVIPVA